MSAKLKEHIRSLLLADTTVSGLVTVSDVKQIYSGRAPQQSRPPYIMFRCVGQEEERHLRGDAGMKVSQYRFNCIATTEDTAEAIAEAVRDALNNYVGGHENGSKIYELAIEEILGDDWSEDVGLYRWIVKAEISHT